ncbi:hypothetical protein SAMN04487996_12282 [Dyadobacter soli]|uniref:Uncharacterized protein n=1 Tax=Dyadobacter soli TaxID=659014 RepID=A0A1G7WKV4_9BACT|nr:hypothetical protein [Dyadobacter soli]SDG72479.1 hypothetical protein SAMN04487996_12282 [Dyadobacter soli]
MKTNADAIEQKRKFLASASLGFRILVFLKIQLVWMEPRPFNGYFTCQKTNKWNPLTWLFLLLLIPFAGAIGIIGFFEDVPAEFETKRHG